MGSPKTDEPMEPQSTEDHRRALGRLVRITAHAVAQLCENAGLVDEAAGIRAEIREVCRPIAMRTAPGAVIESTREEPAPLPPEPNPRASNEGRMKYRGPSAPKPEDYEGEFPEEMRRFRR